MIHLIEAEFVLFDFRGCLRSLLLDEIMRFSALAYQRISIPTDRPDFSDILLKKYFLSELRAYFFLMMASLIGCLRLWVFGKKF
jgi:hypothetical protein